MLLNSENLNLRFTNQISNLLRSNCKNSRPKRRKKRRPRQSARRLLRKLRQKKKLKLKMNSLQEEQTSLTLKVKEELKELTPWPNHNLKMTLMPKPSMRTVRKKNLLMKKKENNVKLLKLKTVSREDFHLEKPLRN